MNNSNLLSLMVIGFCVLFVLFIFAIYGYSVFEPMLQGDFGPFVHNVVLPVAILFVLFLLVVQINVLWWTIRNPGKVERNFKIQQVISIYNAQKRELTEEEWSLFIGCEKAGLIDWDPFFRRARLSDYALQ